MVNQSPYQIFNSWLFDYKLSTPLPQEFIKSSSPISHHYVLNIMTKTGNLNFYLDQHLNNLNLYYLDKEELFFFIKQCVIDFKINPRSIFYKKRKKENKLFNSLKRQYSYLKDHDLILLCDLIESSDDKDTYYQSLGLTSDNTKLKIKKKLDKKNSLNKFLKNFEIINIK